MNDVNDTLGPVQSIKGPNLELVDIDFASVLCCIFSFSSQREVG